MFGRRKNGREADRLSAPAARRHPGRDLRHLRLPGTGDAGGAGARRLLARRRRPAAPRDGQEDQGRDGRAARHASSRAAPTYERHPERQGQRAVRPDRQVRRLRLQQEPRRGLCAARLPDRLAQGASPARILRRLDVLRHAADRQARRLRRRRAAAWAWRCSPPCINRSEAEFTVEDRTTGCSRCATRSAALQVGRRRRDGAARRRARRAAARSPASTTSRAGSTRACSTSVSSRRSPPPARSTRSSPTAPGVHAVADTMLAVAARTHERRRAGRAGCSAEAEPAGDAIRLPQSAHWTLAERMAQEKEAFGFYFSAHPGRSPRAPRENARRTRLRGPVRARHPR